MPNENNQDKNGMKALHSYNLGYSLGRSYYLWKQDLTSTQLQALAATLNPGGSYDKLNYKNGFVKGYSDAYYQKCGNTLPPEVEEKKLESSPKYVVNFGSSSPDSGKDAVETKMNTWKQGEF